MSFLAPIYPASRAHLYKSNLRITKRGNVGRQHHLNMASMPMPLGERLIEPGAEFEDRSIIYRIERGKLVWYRTKTAAQRTCLVSHVIPLMGERVDLVWKMRCVVKDRWIESPTDGLFSILIVDNDIKHERPTPGLIYKPSYAGTLLAPCEFSDYESVVMAKTWRLSFEKRWRETGSAYRSSLSGYRVSPQAG